ncbi:MAG: CopG family ribbon-helix-helix protein [Gemmatimonadota bacterium]
MPKKSFARIAITLPRSDLLAADKLAARHDRSRSWIIAEALRHYVAAEKSRSEASALGLTRSAQLRRDLELTPEQRVREAEQTLRLDDRPLPGRLIQPVTFDSWEAFVEWKRRNGRAS